MTLQQASEITGREIKTHADGFKSISWITEKHTMTIQNCNDSMGLLVLGEPKPWRFGSEVRKGRPRQIWVRNPSEKYLKGLAAANCCE